MKKLILMLAVSLVAIYAQAQQWAPFSMRIGWSGYSAFYEYPNISLFSVDFMLPTKYDNVQYVLGGMYTDPMTSDYRFYGGAIYGGVAMSWGLFTSEVCLGTFQFRHNKGWDAVNSIDILTHTTIGGTMSIGVRLGWEHVYFNPQLSLLYASGTADSFAFWGIKLPLVITF